MVRICLQFRSHRRCSFDLWVGKVPWRSKWQPTPVFLVGESHRQRSLVGYSSWGHKKLDRTGGLTLFTSFKVRLRGADGLAQVYPAGR